MDLTFGTDLRGDYGLFIHAKHFISDWEVDDDVKKISKNYGDALYFRVIYNGGRQGAHGWLEDGEVIQWG
jgi:hypothetical protein